MNKTISINLGGFVFQIDENAYEVLRHYLDELRKRFANTEGRDEIISDIEYRLAELFSEGVSDRKQAIILEDVNRAIAHLGKPEDFEGDDDESKDSAAQHISDAGMKKRLFRDPDDRIIGGVCSGIGAYLNIDTIWVRLAFLIAFFGFGTGLLIYIALLILLPKAETSSEKLQMRGEKPNLKNIEKQIKEEFASVQKNLHSAGVKSFFVRLADMVREIATTLLRFITAIAGVVIVLTGILLLIVLVVFFVPFDGLNKGGFPELIGLVAVGGFEKFIAIAAVFLCALPPIVGITLLSLRTVMFRKLSLKKVAVMLTILWFTGLLAAIAMGLKTASRFSQKQTLTSIVPVSDQESDTLFLAAFSTWWEGGAQIRITDDDYSGFGKFNGITVRNDSLLIRHVRFDIQKSKTGRLEIEQMVSSHGKCDREAHDLATQVAYHVKQQDSLLTFADFLFAEGEKIYRAQRVHLVLYLPQGKTVFIDKSMEPLLLDIANTTNMWDADMVNHFWTMTSSGLACTDCTEDR